jgi:hypothetical protein
MINLVRRDTVTTSLWIDLSDCWTRDGNPVWFQFRKLQSPLDPKCHALSLIVGPLAIKFGWIS